MITGQWSITALRRIRRWQRWLSWYLFKQAAVAEHFANPSTQERMLLDTARCEAYRDALKRIVRQGDIVVDLGAGTGLLSFFAVQAGAQHVYAIEMGRIADIAARLIADNNMSERISLIRGNSTKVRLPKPADLLVSETFSSLGFDSENIIGYLADARQRLLKPDGRMIPASSKTFFMPVESDQFGLGILSKSFYDLDYTTFQMARWPRPSEVGASRKKMVELAEPVHCWPIDFRHENKNPGAATLQFPILREGRLDGFLGWFEGVLCPGVSISNSPRLPPCSWAQIYFPVLDQPKVHPGQILCLEINPRNIAGKTDWDYRISFVASPYTPAVKVA